jgi:hypothetical protein
VCDGFPKYGIIGSSDTASRDWHNLIGSSSVRHSLIAAEGDNRSSSSLPVARYR